jgi:hypothetical protein
MHGSQIGYACLLAIAIRSLVIGMNSLQQQARFDEFAREFNGERPHEALAMKTPRDLYSASAGLI